ncbi:MAG TPA: RHS repeat-associated core domain-containing protein [Candidatus Acidoferrales bacterium]|nr:RHS repeat-associated core domain-containing protein [Candidatus Acidoferrales bacterium]
MKCARLVAVFLFTFLSVSARAQVQTGTPSFGSFTGGPDAINLGNLNSHITIPVLHKPGRGTNFTYDLIYDSSVWYPVGSSGSQNWQPVANWGWAAQTAPVLGFVSYFAQSYPIPPVCRNYVTGVTRFSAFAYSDVFGVNHTFNLTVYNVDGDNPKLCQLPLGGSATTQDGSGYSITVVGEGGPSATIQALNGTKIVPPIGTISGSGTFTDRNGNEITVSGSSFTDTLGTTALSVSGSAPNPVNFTYTSPSNGPVSVTVTYKPYTIKTNFNCSGIAEFGPTNESLVDRVTFPDGSFYQFKYEPTPGFSGDYTGRPASIQLPTGGTISYQYIGQNNGIECTDGSAAGIQRTTPDGTWTYTRSGSPALTTTVTDPSPQANQTVITFTELANNFYEGSRSIYSGSATGGTLLQSVSICYNSNLPCQPFTSLPIVSRRADTTLPGGLVSESELQYNGNGLLTADVESDWGSNGNLGPVIKNVQISYTSLGNGIVDRPSSISFETGTGTVVGQSTFTYDSGTLVTTSGTPQHVAVSGSRGNLTGLSKFVQGSTTLTESFTYFDTGNVDVATDVNGGTTTYTYGGCGNSFATQTVEAISSLQTSEAWNCNGGVPTSTTDENKNSTSYVYDSMWRRTQIKFPDSGETDYTYNDGSPFSITTTNKINSSTNAVTKTILDELGRTSEVQTTSDPAGTDYVNTTYDSLGRVATVSNPYRSTSDPTYGKMQYAYDPLSRITQITDPDNSTATNSYSANCVTATDEQGKNRQSCYDSIGLLTQVTENPGSLGFQTNYGYDPLGNLLSVSEDGSRQRTFTYDGLSRLLTAANPESGTVTYTYDTYKKGDLATKKDARGITTTYSYDLLHRLTSKSYSDGTPTASYSYDQTSVWGVSPQNPLGHMTLASTPNTGTVFGYDQMGRTIQEWQATPYNYGKGSWSLTFGYDSLGDLTSYTNGVGVTFTQTFNGAKELTQIASNLVDPQHPGTLAAFNSFLPFGGIKSMSFGNGLTQTMAFNNRLQLCRVNSNSSGTALNTCTDSTPSGNLLDLAYTWNAGTADNGNVMGWSAAGNQTFNRSYTYDALNRLGGMSDSDSVASCQGLSWSYDAWGNRTAQTPTKGTCGSWSVSYTTQNQVSGYTYDSAGNLLNDGQHTYSYDAENRITQVDGGSTATYLYDALGHRVRKTASGATLDNLFDLSGNIIAEVNAGAWWAGYVYAGNQLTAEYENSTTYFIHPDHLSSIRLMTGVNQSVYDSMDFLPFGEQESGGSGSSHKFTGYSRDTETNLDYAMFRQYSSRSGSFMQPDPYNAGANVVNPQAWNAYSYVLNNPLHFRDPLGLFCVWDDGSYDSQYDPQTDSPNACEGQGGTWFDGSPSQYGFSGDWSSQGNSTLAGFVNDFTNGQGGGFGNGIVEPGDYQSYQEYGPTSGLLALQMAGQEASPITNPAFVPCFYTFSAIGGSAGLFTAGLVQDFGVMGAYNTIQRLASKYGGPVVAGVQSLARVCNQGVPQ